MRESGGGSDGHDRQGQGVKRLTPAEQRHEVVCQFVQRLRRERGQEPGSVEDLMPLSVGQLLKIQADLLKLPIVRPEFEPQTLFDVEQRGPDQAA